MLKKLDQLEFGGFRLWDFSYHSLFRRYGWFFLRHFVLAQPLKFSSRFNQYLQNHDSLKPAELTTIPDLVAVGYCMKPVKSDSQYSQCPAGRFNHDCRLLDLNLIQNGRQKTWPQPCLSCQMAELAKFALQNSSHFYIMTSALDIATDLLKPQYQEQRWRSGVFILCHYATAAFAFALAIAGLPGVFINFCSGDCKNYQDFVLADDGIKNERTRVASQDWQSLAHFFKLNRVEFTNKIGQITKQQNIYFSEARIP